MKSTIKFAALGALALAASSTAALAGSELPAGITTGLALGAPLPEGVYDISIASYGSRGDGANSNLAYAVPVWLIWSTPWQIAGARVMLDTATGVADTWTPGHAGTDSFLNTLVNGTLAWNFGNGWNAALRAGAWLPSTQTLSMALGRDYTAFQGGAAVSYVANGWNLSANAFYGSGGDNTSSTNYQPAWFNLDLTATKKLGKMEIGAIAYGSWDLDARTACGTLRNPALCKQSQFAVGGLVGYDFGSFIAQAKLAGDVSEENYGGKEVRGSINIIKPLWNPEAGSLK
jgi:hypothetical protein